MSAVEWMRITASTPVSSRYSLYMGFIWLKSVKKAESQSDKFKRAARDLECDPDEAKWEDNLRKVVKPKPAEKSHGAG